MARIVHLSDIHFGGEEKKATAAAVEFAHAAAPDLVLVTGDITLNGLPPEFAAAKAWLDALPTPRLVTPGNHDTPYWNLLLRALTPFARYRRYIGEPNGEAFDGSGVRARTINTARGAQPRPDWSKGAINLARCSDVASTMAGASDVSDVDAVRIVACHHPLVEALDSPVTGGVYRGDDAAAVLAEGDVDLILTGHVHNPFATPLPYGDKHTYAVGAGTLSLRLRGTPASFNVIDTDAETITVVAQGWSGSRYEPYRTWALPRRSRVAASPALIEV